MEDGSKMRKIIHIETVNAGERFAAAAARRMEKAPGGFGERTLMRAAFCVQEMCGAPLGYRFSLYVWGPEDDRVLLDLQTARQAGQVRLEYPAGRGDALIVPEPGEKPGEETFSIALEKAAARIETMTPPQAALWVTLGFLTGRLGMNNEETVAATLEMKPHLAEPEVRDMLTTLRQAGGRKE